MDGGEIFTFTLKSVPPLINETVETAGLPREEYDAFLLHQANTFMINHIAKKAKLPREKVPINIDRYGNTSSATIPLLMTTDLAKELTERKMRLGMFGFGVGYSWASASLDVGPLRCVETITL
jgi:3-oxoacyl-[acyl-carrier-protein] synthase-3